MSRSAFAKARYTLFLRIQYKFYTMILTTTNSIQGKEITNYIGIVTGHKYVNTYSTKGLSFKEQLTMKKGLENAEKDLEKAKKEALDRLVEKAEEMHAMAVIGVTMDVEVLRQGITLSIATMGTAVIYK